MLKLYHGVATICSQKVRVCLAEKGLTYEAIDAMPLLRTKDYLALNPGGYVPTLVHNGKVITESRVICEYIDDAFPEPPLMPADPFDRASVRLWTKQIDDALHRCIFILTFFSGKPWARQMTSEQFEARLPMDPFKRDLSRDIMINTEKSHYIAIALRRFEKLFNDMEKALSQTRWLVGAEYTLADCDFTPYIQRIYDLGLNFLGQNRPYLTNWFDRVQTRPSFAAVLKNWIDPAVLEQQKSAVPEFSSLFKEILNAAA